MLECMYAYMYVCIYVCMYIHVYVCIYVCMYIRMYVCMYIRMYVCMYVCMYVYTFVCFYVLMNSIIDSFFPKQRWLEIQSYQTTSYFPSSPHRISPPVIILNLYVCMYVCMYGQYVD